MPKNLETDAPTTASAESSTVADVQALINDTQTLITGEELMFAMDVPYVPPQETPVVLAQAGTASASVTPDFIFTDCRETEHTQDGSISLFGGILPNYMLGYYLSNRGVNVKPEDIKVTLLSAPQHGKFNGYRYDPTPGYLGNDNATFMAEYKGKKYKIVVTIKVLPGVDENSHTCPPPKLIKVNNKSVSDASPYQLNSFTVAFGDLTGSAVGTTVSTGPTAQITLDADAAGHGWYVDATPLDNTDDYRPTSNPNIWQAKAGTDAASKMDMLSVLLHEYGHALGLEHSANSSDFMAATLQVGERRLPSADGLTLMSQLVAQLKASTALADGSIPTDPVTPTVPNPSLPLGALLIGRLTLGRKPDDEERGSQALNGLAELAAQGVTHVTHADGSRTYLVDLSGIARDADGTVAVNLSFDLIGFGGTAATMGSHAGGEVITPSGKNFVVPAQASMTVKQANEWQRTLGAGLETLVNLKATLREQAAQAVRTANDIVLAARNAMEDANAAAQLMMTNPIRNFNELLQTLGKEFSGDALYKKVIEKAKDMVCKLLVLPRTIMEGACFAAGTLVHTKDGLKPIEQIEVGDWVLSKPESGEGEQAYKRVAKTFSFEDKQVMIISCVLLRDSNDHFHDDLIVTPNHPFWVVGVDKSCYPDSFTWDDFKLGWTRADELIFGALIELPNGEYARVESSERKRLWKTLQPNIAWEATADETHGFYRVIDDKSNISSDHELTLNMDYYEDESFRYRLESPEWENKWFYRTKVYKRLTINFSEVLKLRDET